MQTSEVYSILKTVGLPIAYHHFNAASSIPPLPYLVYFTDGEENITSDGQIHATWKDYVVELYSDKKNEAVENRVKVALKQISIDFEKISEIYLNTEKMYQIVYGLRTLQRVHDTPTQSILMDGNYLLNGYLDLEGTEDRNIYN